MIYILMIAVFVLGYAMIALEHNIHIDKAASALLTGVAAWTLLVLGADGVFGIDLSVSIDSWISDPGVKLQGFADWVSQQAIVNEVGMAAQTADAHETGHVVTHYVVHGLQHHLIEIAEILFFLIGAMTIVEVIDAHEGFAVVTDKITTTKKSTLLWIICILTFFFSAALDNLTTSIVMAALLKKLIADKKDLWIFAGMVIISANAGGAWSPIGDVTTIMLWVGGQVTAGTIIMKAFLPSLVCMLIPLIWISKTLKGNVTRPEKSNADGHETDPTTDFERKFVFFFGVAALLMVPVFKTITHLPPFMGILGGLGAMWFATELLHRKKSFSSKSNLSVIGVLKKIDTPSVLFFLGILIAVGALSTAGHLVDLAGGLQSAIGDIYVINVIIGVLSSIVDNVPLVAGAMGMYDIGAYDPGVAYPQDHEFWVFLAYCAGTGGSCLIIGSAAGVAIMGILKIDFVWYMKKMSLPALVGYLAGAAVYILMFGDFI
jgi:Na+/H+ antiporter NhaD/arsenite permease-like protein